MTDIKKRLQSIHNVIEQTKIDVQRSHEQVRLLAVSKTWPAETVRIAAMAGQTEFGENYLQEALNKIVALNDLRLTWHFIGPIQSNKTKDIANYFDWVQSVDRLKIAKRLNEQRPEDLTPLQICIQINIDDETSKAGIKPEDLFDFATEITALTKLKLRGLMFIPAKTDDAQQQAKTFQKANALFEQLKAQYPDIDTLSMGMTADMQAAIAEGSTMIRVGTGLFGQRNSTEKK
jgi:hypothetical protein